MDAGAAHAIEGLAVGEEALSAPTPEEDEHLRATIRSALEKADALPVARRTLLLMIEAVVEPAPTPQGYRILDRAGRLREPGPEGPAPVPGTLREVIDALRVRHPALFAKPPEPEPTALLAEAKPRKRSWLRAQKAPEPASEAIPGRVAGPIPTAAKDTPRPDPMAGLRAVSARWAGASSDRARALATQSQRQGRALASAATERFTGLRARLDAPTRPDAPVPAPAPAETRPAETPPDTAVLAPARPWPANPERPRPTPGARRQDLSARVVAVRDRLAGAPRRSLAMAAAGALAAVLLAVVLVTGRGGEEARETAAPAATPQGESAPVAPEPRPPATPEPPRNPNELAGVPEVIDTATLRVAGKLVRLFGVEWVRGGQAEELTKYLADRSVTCQPAPGSSAHLCIVDGRDLSEVVLFNGGGRASSEATPDLAAAEDHARTERLGVWKR